MNNAVGPGEPVSSVGISIVVPSWCDAENLAVLLPKLAQLTRCAETIVVDASGDVTSEQIARANGAAFHVCAKPSRGAQMNLGAKAAAAGVLLFQHADTELTGAHLQAIELALGDPEIGGGAFYREFDDRHPRLKWLEPVGRFLTRNGGTFYGDQSVFVRRDIFEKLNGFAEIPLMEDVEFSRRLRAAGKTVVLDPPVRTSSRRHLREGAWRKTIQNGLFLFLYKLGVSPVQLHRWYYADKETKQPEKTGSPQRGGLTAK